MSNILITGATGNVGHEVIRFLTKTETSNQIIAGVRNITKAEEVFKNYSNLQFVHFDFENANTFKGLANIDRIFYCGHHIFLI